MIAQSMSGVSFENPAMASLFESHPQISAQQFHMQQFNLAQSDDKVSAWNNQLFAAQQLQQQQQQQQFGGNHLFTPPPSSHGPSSAGPNFGNAAYFASMRQQQQMHMFGSPVDNEDASSVGSAHMGRRERSGSMGAGSGFDSPPHSRHVTSPSGSYDMPSLLSNGGGQGADGYGAPKRINTGAIPTWARDEMGPMATSPISITGGGGGNGNGFAMMMM